MKVILMNRNSEALKTELIENSFTDIIDIINIVYAPLSVYNAYFDKSKGTIKSLNE